jgi:two-component system OmpR family sensor kinase
MPPEVAARVFERFYRADTSRTRAGATTTGSGLGLSIVAALVAAHGGSVDVRSEPGRGSCFTVSLPTSG